MTRSEMHEARNSPEMRHRIATPNNTLTAATPKQETSEIGVKVHISNPKVRNYPQNQSRKQGS